MGIKLTRVVKILLIANFVTFIVQHTSDQYLGGDFTGIFGLVPSGFVLKFRIWQIATYAFLHGDVMHLFLNLLLLLFIGGEMETAWGAARFLKYYFFCSVAAGLVYLFMQAVVMGGPALHIPMIGASGAIYGLLVAYGIVFGERTLLFMMLFPMKAKHFIWILAAIEFMTSVFSPSGGLSSVAHLAGMGAGFGYLWGRAYWVTRNAFRKRGGESGRGSAKKRSGGKKSHLKLVIDNDEGEERDSEDKPKGPTWH